MLCRPLDADDDMRPVGNQKQMISGKEAVLEAVKSRLHLLLGEWWEDESLGFVVPRLIYEGVRTEEGRTMLVNYITAYVAQTPGVVAVQDVSGTVEGRALAYTCTIITEYGEIEGSVSSDALYVAVS